MVDEQDLTSHMTMESLCLLFGKKFPKKARWYACDCLERYVSLYGTEGANLAMEFILKVRRRIKENAAASVYSAMFDTAQKTPGLPYAARHLVNNDTSLCCFYSADVRVDLRCWHAAEIFKATNTEEGGDVESRFLGERRVRRRVYKEECEDIIKEITELLRDGEDYP